MKRLARRLTLPLTGLARRTVFEVIVDQAHRLHERVDASSGPRTSSRVSSGPSTSAVDAAVVGIFISASRVTCGGRSAAAGSNRQTYAASDPHSSCSSERALRVVDRRFDLAAMADDAFVFQQPRHVARAECRDRRWIEAGEGFPEVFALAQNRQPAEAGLESFEADLLEQPTVIRDRPSPFLVVILNVERIGARPPAACHATMIFAGLKSRATCLGRGTEVPRYAAACETQRRRLRPSDSSAVRAARSSRRFSPSISGNSGCRLSSVSTTADATTSRVNHLLSAGTTYHGAHAVAVALIASSYAFCSRRSAGVRARRTSRTSSSSRARRAASGTASSVPPSRRGGRTCARRCPGATGSVRSC